MASRFYQRPENAISKAEEFIKVGKPTRALDTLYDVIKTKTKRHTISEKLIEQIMFKYLELCVDLKKSHVAKEGLFQYRNMCQATNVASLASVVQGYLTMAEKRTDSARQESQESVQDVDDLENLSTPEMIMLSAVSGEDAQDRSDRTILMPWVKFLWESYCQCLELLRTNLRVERLYHDIAQQAFKFCLKYQRKTEFRKLCDKLRNHLELILKQTPSPVAINLNNAETQQMNLDTRLVQLDAAIQMELWQEAYKAVEDIHGLMTISKKVFQPKMMANYYQKLALVFWKSGNHLFHAAALSKHFQLTREMKKNISADELGKMASRVLMACLAVPIPSQHPEFDKFIETDRTPQEKMARLAVLLSLQQPPTRQTLLKDAKRFGVVQAATQEVKEMYNWLEIEFHPLKLCKRVDKSVDFIEKSEDLASLTQYIPAVKEVTLVRLLKQVSQVYQSICYQRLLELASFADAFALERCIVDCVRHNDMQIRVDHRTRTVHFGTDLAEAQSYDVVEGPHLQDMPSEQIRTQLMLMLEILDKSIKTILPNKVKNENQHLRLKIVEAYHQSKNRDHQRILSRQKIIEERKEYLEKLSIIREADEQRKHEEQVRERQKQEEERLKAEQLQREEMQNQRRLKQAQQESVKQKLLQIGQTDIGKKILDELDEQEIAELDTEKIMARQVEELEKEKRELNARLKAQEKKVDHMERAKRREEIPLLKETFIKDKENDKEFWKKLEEDRIAKVIADREVAVQAKARLVRMNDDKTSYLSQLLDERKNAFEIKLKEFNERLNQEREKRLEERKEKRKENRRQKYLKEKEEEAQRLREEQIKREREEANRREAERKAKEEEEYRKRLENLDAIEAKKKQRELEIEERQKKELEEERSKKREQNRREEDESKSWRKDPSRDERDGRSDRDRDRGERRDNKPGGAWKPGAGNWREREREKDDEWGPRRGGDNTRDEDWQRVSKRHDRDDRGGAYGRDDRRRNDDGRGFDRAFRRDGRRDDRRDDREFEMERRDKQEREEPKSWRKDPSRDERDNRSDRDRDRGERIRDKPGGAWKAGSGNWRDREKDNERGPRRGGEDGRNDDWQKVSRRHDRDDRGGGNTQDDRRRNDDGRGFDRAFRRDDRRDDRRRVWGKTSSNPSSDQKSHPREG